MLAQAAEAAGSWQSILLALALLGQLVSVVFVYRVLVRGGSPASTLLWMAVIIVAPWLGLVLYYLLPRRLQLRRLRRMRVRGNRLREVRGRESHRRDDAPITSGLQALLAAGNGLSFGNEITWLAGGGDFTRAAAVAIGAAQRQVHCLVYIFRPDAAGLRFLEVLTAAARRGITVRLLYDSFGSLGLKNSHLAGLRAAGGHVVPFMPLLWKRRPFTVNLRNHRKLLIVDGEVGFIGGRNVGDEYFFDKLGNQREWQDAMLGLRGPAVDLMQDVFVEDWCTATDEVLTDTFVLPRDLGPARVGIVGSGPDREHSELWYALVQGIGEATTSIDLSSPYLVLPPTLLFVLQLAAARGVRVRIFTNGPKTEGAVLYHAQRSYYKRLLASGIQLFETVDVYNHAKMLVIDGRTVLVGSANMDLRSAHLNFEIAAVAVDAPDLARDVLATMETRLRGYKQLRVSDLPREPWKRALDGACGLLSPLL